MPEEKKLPDLTCACKVDVEMNVFELLDGLSEEQNVQVIEWLVSQLHETSSVYKVQTILDNARKYGVWY